MKSTKTMLIVEDQPDICRLLQVIFSAAGFALRTASSGEQALELARQSPPQVVLLDVMLPGALDGFEVARRLRAEAATADCGIVILTAKAKEEDRREALGCGADAYLTKPFAVSDLMAAVNSLRSVA